MYFAGLDGGGTKTSIAVADENQRILLLDNCGGTNIWGCDPVIVRDNYRRLFQDVCGKLGIDHLQRVVIGDSSLSVGQRHMLPDKIRSVIPSEQVDVCSDVEIALNAADEEYTSIIISGTGSVLSLRNWQGLFSVGGYGHLIGDRGSAFDIGMNGMRLAVEALDGTVKPTILTEELLRYFSVECVQDVIEKVYASPWNKSRIAEFSQRVEQCAEQGDEQANLILNEAARQLFVQWEALLLKASGGIGSVYLHGGVVASGGKVAIRLEKLIAESHPEMQVRPLPVSPVTGALRLCFTRPYQGDLA